MPVRQEYVVLRGSKRERPTHHQFVGPVDADKEIAVTLIVRPRPGGPPLPDLEHWQATPPHRRRYPAPDEYAASYGAAQADIDAITAFAATNGLAVLDSHPARRSVTLKGTAAQLNRAFDTTINRYEARDPQVVPYKSTKTVNSPQATHTNAHTYHGYDGHVRLPSQLEHVVQAVVGLDNRRSGRAGIGSGDPPFARPMSVPEIAKYYNFPNTGAADQTIAVIAPSAPPGEGDRPYSGYLASDILDLYFPGLADGAYRKPPVLNDINVTVGANTYGNRTDAVAAGGGFVMEVTQDICTCATVAQGATINVYFTEASEQGLIACLNRILVPEGERQPTVVTCSFGFRHSDGTIGSPSEPGSVAAIVSDLFQRLAAVGITVFMISHDDGSNSFVGDGAAHVNYPGSDPWVTCVGGTVIGRVSDAAAPSEEWVWNNIGCPDAVGSFHGASGGGASQTFPLPCYQRLAGITQITDSKGNVLTNRLTPDIAGMVACGGSGETDWLYINGHRFQMTGTSCAAPLFAGLTAVLRSALNLKLGILNPTLYQLGTSVCNDVTQGNNDPGLHTPYYRSGDGWDPCTGWGSIDGTRLLDALSKMMRPAPG
ncbi:S53 family peptidase [Paraburkholderia saeva]|uniref:S53 family peptidase n=1 Tax=Paraburkholderia saeva TaxID=2777537 RepID=UPI001DAD7FB1|nr:S53 family peptidase [Paraburkholderia saeva]CAG4928584.1 Pseudomonalisin [Paraburkholderia saeva]